MNSPSKLQLFGYCDMPSHEIEICMEKEFYHKLTHLGGEYTLVYDNSIKTVVITSCIGGIHYFYYYDGARFAHGQHILDIVRSLDLKWVWDWESIGDLCVQENLTDNRTLHKEIKRVPPGSILTYSSDLRIWTKNIIDEFKQTYSDPTEAIDILNSETRKWITSNPYLSLSGGFDSRVLLSSMLKSDVYPTVVTVGDGGSTDNIVAGKITDYFGLKQIIVDLELDDLLKGGEYISFITNGSKPVCHWHTFLYPRKAGLNKNHPFFVGTLGEFARNYYFDYGILGKVAEPFGVPLVKNFWERKFFRHFPFRIHEIQFLGEEMKTELDYPGFVKRSRRNARLSRGGILSGGTRFYIEQRIPNFYANGIRMYNDTTLWRSPFHSIEWLNVVWSLDDNWKLGSNWHRLAIRRNVQKLLDFPEEKGLVHNKMLSKSPPLYWMSAMQRAKYKTYDLSGKWFQDKRIKEFIMDNTSYLDEFINAKLCEVVIEEHSLQGNRTKAISFLLTLLYFRLAIKRYL